MRILYHHRIRSKDGQYVHLEEMIHALVGLGHEVKIVGPRHVEDERFGADAGYVASLKKWLPGAVYEALELGYALADYRRLAATIRSFRPDVIYERYNLYFPSGIWARRRFQLPLLLEVNAPLYEERQRFGGIALPGLAQWSERYAWRGADLVLPVTEVLARHVVARGVPRERIHVIPNGINEQAFAALPDPSGRQAQARAGRPLRARLRRLHARLARSRPRAALHEGPAAARPSCALRRRRARSCPPRAHRRRARAVLAPDDHRRRRAPGRPGSDCRLRHRAAACGRRVRLAAEALRVPVRRPADRGTGLAQHPRGAERRRQRAAVRSRSGGQFQPGTGPPVVGRGPATATRVHARPRRSATATSPGREMREGSRGSPNRWPGRGHRHARSDRHADHLRRRAVDAVLPVHRAACSGSGSAT